MMKHEVYKVYLRFQAVCRLSLAVVLLQKVAQGCYVALCHLQGLELAELVVGAEARHDLAQLVEGVVQAVHATPFARVRGEAPALQDGR